MPDVRFTVLGRVAVTVDDAEVVVGGPRERTVLATLLAARGQVVPIGQLVEEVWSERPPATPRSSLQVAVSRLRRVLDPGRATSGATSAIVSSGVGYRLAVEADRLDSTRMTAHVDAARAAAGDHDDARVLVSCQEALGLWTGAPFGDITIGPQLRAEATRLTEIHLEALVLSAQARLQLGEQQAVAVEVEHLLAAHPLREPLWGLLARAYYRGGRQADALAALRRAVSCWPIRWASTCPPSCGSSSPTSCARLPACRVRRWQLPPSPTDRRVSSGVPTPAPRSSAPFNVPGREAGARRLSWAKRASARPGWPRPSSIALPTIRSGCCGVSATRPTSPPRTGRGYRWCGASTTGHRRHSCERCSTRPERTSPPIPPRPPCGPTTRSPR